MGSTKEIEMTTKTLSERVAKRYQQLLDAGTDRVATLAALDDLNSIIRMQEREKLAASIRAIAADRSGAEIADELEAMNEHRSAWM